MALCAPRITEMGKFSRKFVLNEIKAYIIMAIGLMTYSFSWTAIIVPADFIAGGIPGVSQLIFYATGGASDGGIPIGISYFTINVVLITIAAFIIGPKFGVKTIFAMCFNSVALTVFQEALPAGLVGLQDDMLLSAILGGALCGLGIGICFWQGGSTGGTDIIAMIINKYRNVSLGKVIMFCDVIIIASSYLIFQSIPTIIYGYVTLAVTGYTIDMFLQGNRQSCQLVVISKHYQEIADRIVVEAHRGVTILDGAGWYTKNKQNVLMVFCRKNEATIIYRIIKEVDNAAFISNAAISAVYGNGFENLKGIKIKNSPKNPAS